MAITPFKVIKGHRVWYQLKALCDFLLVINTNLPPILHRFRDIAFDRCKTTMFGYIYPSCVYLPQTEGSPGTISVKFYLDVNGWRSTKWRRNIAENFNRLSRVYERYRQTTDRQTDRSQTDRRTDDDI